MIGIGFCYHRIGKPIYLLGTGLQSFSFIRFNNSIFLGPAHWELLARGRALGKSGVLQFQSNSAQIIANHIIFMLLRSRRVPDRVRIHGVLIQILVFDDQKFPLISFSELFINL